MLLIPNLVKSASAEPCRMTTEGMSEINVKFQYITLSIDEAFK